MHHVYLLRHGCNTVTIVVVVVVVTVGVAAVAAFIALIFGHQIAVSMWLLLLLIMAHWIIVKVGTLPGARIELGRCT